MPERDDSEWACSASEYFIHGHIQCMIISVLQELKLGGGSRNEQPEYSAGYEEANIRRNSK
nr:ADM_HP1_G0050060.mRNA.1.CDS.1 [Saccharomyces cerevisiae]